MDKKFAPILLVIVLVLLAVAAIYWRGQNPSALPEPQVADGQNQATQQPPTLDTAPVSTADWKTYENRKYGYKIELPRSWGTVSDFDGSYMSEISQDSDYLHLGTDKGLKAQISINDDTNTSKNIANWTDWYVNFFLNTEYKRQAVKIGGLDGVLIITPSSQEYEKLKNKHLYLVENNNRLYEIIFFENDNITDHIISTFKFLK